MRAVISFWQRPTDEAALFAFLRSTGTLVARPNQSQPESEPLEFQPLSVFRRQNFGTLLICQESEVENVRRHRYKANGQSWHTVDVDPSPVFTYSREPLNRRQLYLSSLGAALDYVQRSTGQRWHKTPEFKRWVKAVVAWVKERCTETCELHGFDYPATPAVRAALEAGKIVLRT